MSERKITMEQVEAFCRHLESEEKRPVTVEKYRRDARHFLVFADGKEVTREVTVAYKNELLAHGYAVRSINSMLTVMNGLLSFLGLEDCRVKSIRMQRQIYSAEDKELTKEEYRKLLNASRDNEKLNLILQTICSTGIRVSELQYFTVEAAAAGEVIVDCKNKTRVILIPSRLKAMLLKYAKKQKIPGGVIFVTKNGKPMDRSNIWSAMKKLCMAAGVKASKVFPHNLRKLFARTFYCLEKDIAKLADILGHSSINTTRIYIMTTGTEHRKKIERLGLIP